MCFKKIILVVGFLAIAGMVFWGNTPTAQAATAAELQALIVQLQQQIAELQKQLAEITSQETVWCYDFSRNLKFGNAGEDVKALQTALQKEGLYGYPAMESTDKSGDFGEYTASAVVGFQEKYASEILAQWGLEHGTGFVGSSTREKLNALYGCGITRPACQMLWWRDNDHQYCQQKQFCGLYMYLGLRTFKTQAECEAPLKEVKKPMDLSHVKVASLYERVTDYIPLGGSVNDVITQLKETRTDFIFRGFWKWASCPDSGGKDGYSYQDLKKTISQIKQEMPEVIFCGAIPAQRINYIEVNPITGHNYGYSEIEAMALDPAKWGITSVSKKDLQKTMQEHGTGGAAYFPDITNPEFQNLILTWAEKQIDSGADAIWIDALWAQARLFKSSAKNYPAEYKKIMAAAGESFDAALKIVDEIHKYGQMKGKSIYVGTWSLHNDVFPAEDYQARNLDFVTATPSSEEIQAKQLNNQNWNTIIQDSKDHSGDIPIFSFIDWADDNTPLAIFSQKLSAEEQREFLEYADDFFQNKGINFIYPVHGGYMGQSATRLSYGKYKTYDSIAPEFQTYEAIKELARKKAGEEVKVETICTDGIDNDKDGCADYDDVDCNYNKLADSDGDGYYSNKSESAGHYTAWCSGTYDYKCPSGSERTKCVNESMGTHCTSCSYCLMCYAVCAGADCDDSNPNINPGAKEICQDGIDNDCDGQMDYQDSDCKKQKTTIFLFKDLKTCIVGDKCTSGNCKKLYKDGNTFMEFEDNSNFKSLKPNDPEPKNYQLKKCLETKLDDSEVSYLKGEITKFLNKVSNWSKNSITLSSEYIEIPSIEIAMSRWGDGFWLAPGDIKSLVAQNITKDTDFVIVSNDIYDDTEGVYWGIGGCDGSFGANNGLGGAGYSWVPKTNPGFWFECAGEKTYIHGWLHQLDYALEYVSEVEDIYKDNFPKSLCGNADSNPYKWFPSPDTASRDPDFPACKSYYDNWSGYCDSIKPRDCDFEWDEHLLSVHYDPKTNLIGNHCRNGKQDFDETGIDCGGKCPPCQAGTNLPPVIDGLSAPSQLRVNETGTWTIKAHDPENGRLTYSVRWGDEVYSTTTEQRMLSTGTASQTTTFTHSYSKAGNYTISFTVTDDQSQTAKTSTTVNVVSTTTPSITVTSPNGGEQWMAGTTHNITWTASNFPTGSNLIIALNIFDSAGNFVGKPRPLPYQSSYAQEFPATNGSYSWTIPSTIQNDFGLSNMNYLKISVQDSGKTGAMDSSDNYFSIVEKVPTTETSCTDGIDNDKDGCVDYDDVDCNYNKLVDNDGDGYYSSKSELAGHQTAACSGTYNYNCPKGSQRTKCVNEGLGTHCTSCSSCLMAYVVCAGTDCDDSNPNVYPGAKEICGDGIDNDCDGLLDDKDKECKSCSLGLYNWTDTRASKTACDNYCKDQGYSGGKVSATGSKSCAGAYCSYISDFSNCNQSDVRNDGNCGCNNQFTCQCEGKTVGLKAMQNQLASISAAVSQVAERIKQLLMR